jgi:gas vesicle protein
MSSEQSTRRGGSGMAVVLGVLLGIAVGVILALLFAPQEGEATRKQVAEQSANLRRHYTDAIAQGRQAYQQASQNAREEILERM